MNKRLALQITALLLVTSALIGMWVATPVYDEVKAGIVEVLCLSCLKLEPKTIKEYTFTTVDNQSHPSFVLDNLSVGPVFLEYSGDACEGCTIMLPVIQALFNITYDDQELVSRKVDYKGTTLTFYYTNINHAPSERITSQRVYDVLEKGGIPMFTMVTLGYDHGDVRPIYVTLYGTLLLDNNDDRLAYLSTILEESIEMYHQNSAGYQHH